MEVPRLDEYVSTRPSRLRLGLEHILHLALFQVVHVDVNTIYGMRVSLTTLSQLFGLPDLRQASPFVASLRFVEATVIRGWWSGEDVKRARSEEKVAAGCWESREMWIDLMVRELQARCERV
jgi:hypothetical protein